jgi:hypothetical protein
MLYNITGRWYSNEQQGCEVAETSQVNVRVVGPPPDKLTVRIFRRPIIFIL